MNELLTTEQQKWYKEFCDFVEEFVFPFAHNWEEEEFIPQEVILICAKKGYLGGLAPQEYGGLGWDITTYGLFMEVLARASTSLSGLFNVHNMVIQTLIKWGNEQQKDKWL